MTDGSKRFWEPILGPVLEAILGSISDPSKWPFVGTTRATFGPGHEFQESLQYVKKYIHYEGGGTSGARPRKWSPRGGAVPRGPKTPSKEASQKAPKQTPK